MVEIYMSTLAENAFPDVTLRYAETFISQLIIAMSKN